MGGQLLCNTAVHVFTRMLYIFCCCYLPRFLNWLVEAKKKMQYICVIIYFI